jgi:UDP-GlcNAc:undecaprenyl-phosphate/decaprenyl-phosphate GlcNAc-1-phosphate transferase
MFIELWPLVFAALCSAVLMPLAIRVRSVGRDDNFSGVQKVHAISTSRLGGGVVLVAYLATLAWAMPPENAIRWWGVRLATCCLPVVLVGLREDVTGRVHPWHRLGASVISAALASWLAAGIIGRFDIPIVDGWLKYMSVALPLTWFMVTGACNAVNIIDGAHGLAGGTALMMFVGLAAIAGHVGDGIVLAQALAMAGAIIGFLAWNYPRGKVFLGDAGAYFLGFMYAELSIQIVNNNSGVSAWFVIALAAYPIVETLYSIYRRKLVLRTASMQADALHLHSLLFRRLAAQRGGVPRSLALAWANARVAPRLWRHGALCLVAALLLYDNTRALIGFAAVYCVFYVASYRALKRERRGRIGTSVSRTLTRHVEESGK